MTIKKKVERKENIPKYCHTQFQCNCLYSCKYNICIIFFFYKIKLHATKNRFLFIQNQTDKLFQQRKKPQLETSLYIHTKPFLTCDKINYKKNGEEENIPKWCHTFRLSGYQRLVRRARNGTLEAQACPVAHPQTFQASLVVTGFCHCRHAHAQTLYIALAAPRSKWRRENCPSPFLASLRLFLTSIIFSRFVYQYIYRKREDRQRNQVLEVGYENWDLEFRGTPKRIARAMKVCQSVSRFYLCVLFWKGIYAYSKRYILCICQKENNFGK